MSGADKGDRRCASLTRQKARADLGDVPIEYEADGLEATRDGDWLLNGHVLIRQGERTLKTQQRPL